LCESKLGKFALFLDQGSDVKKVFGEDEKNLIKTFFTVAMSAVENLKMLNLRRDVELAFEIQKNLLPQETPSKFKT
jgi:hypothetical protein